jgi:phosphatidate cytidylyltransferase
MPQTWRKIKSNLLYAEEGNLYFTLIKHKQLNPIFVSINQTMALDLKKLGTRALSALIFVVVLLTCVMWNYTSFTVFFFIVSLWGLTEFYKLGPALGYTPYQKIGYLTATLLYLVFIQWPLLSDLSSFSGFSVLLIVPIPFLILISAVFDKSEHPFSNAIYTCAGSLYAVLPFALLHELVAHKMTLNFNFEPRYLIGVILLIWSNDTFAYLGGSLIGKNKMIPRVSPGKTWEGTIAGVIITFALSFLVAPLLSLPSSSFWLYAGATVPVLATLGDLLESVIKRQAGVKDTGNVLPGHGGILDRFDSLIFVSPFAVVVLKLLVQ